MLATSLESLSASPTLILSQMSDPTTLSTLCSPFLHGIAISPDDFDLSHVKTDLIPSVKRTIITREVTKFANVPKLVKLIVDNFNTDGLSIVLDELLPTIVACNTSFPPVHAHDFQDLYLDALSALPSRVRDDVLVDVVTALSESPDFRLRILAVLVIMLVRSQSRVAMAFKSLALDRVPNVRSTAISALRNCNFDSFLVEYVLTNAARDFSFHVRNETASVIGFVAPKLVGPYLELLENSSTMERALDSLSLVVEENGLECLFNSLIRAIRAYPDKCAQLIVDCAVTGKIDASEHRLLFRLAKLLKHVPEFVVRLYQFSEVFEAKRRFLKFFTISRMRSMTEKVLYSQQAALFVKDLGSEMLPVAVGFARDDAACVRNESVKIFVALYDQDERMAERISAALLETLQMKLVLVKVIVALKAPVAFWEVARVLVYDSVMDVQSVLAEGVKDLTDFCKRKRHNSMGVNSMCILVLPGGDDWLRTGTCQADH